MNRAPIRVEYIYPPIPIRDFDYEATREGWDLGWPIGHGRTREAAIADLLMQEESYADH